MSRILLSVLLFAGAFTSLLDGRLDSERILAQNVSTGWVLIKRFPLHTTLATELKTAQPIFANLVSGPWTG